MVKESLSPTALKILVETILSGNTVYLVERIRKSEGGNLYNAHRRDDIDIAYVFYTKKWSNERGALYSSGTREVGFNYKPTTLKTDSNGFTCLNDIGKWEKYNAVENYGIPVNSIEELEDVLRQRFGLGHIIPTIQNIAKEIKPT